MYYVCESNVCPSRKTITNFTGTQVCVTLTHKFHGSYKHSQETQFMARFLQSLNAQICSNKIF